MSTTLLDSRPRRFTMTKPGETEGLTFAVAVNDRELFDTNFLASPCFQAPHNYQILVQENFSSAAKAYNNAIDRSVNDLIVFAHQDMIFPESWLPQLQIALEYLREHDPNWGVLGAYGKAWDGTGWGHVYSAGRGIIGEEFENPVPIQTLDEIVLILRKSSGLRFDDQLPHFHFYGSDICLRAAQRGLKSYAVSAFCVHNAQQKLLLPKEFYECYRYVRRAWKTELPIQTTCIQISRFSLPVYVRRLREAYHRLIRRNNTVASRATDVQGLLRKLESAPPGLKSRAPEICSKSNKGTST